MPPSGKGNSGIMNSGITLAFDWKGEAEKFVGGKLSQHGQVIKNQSDCGYNWDEGGKKNNKII